MKKKDSELIFNFFCNIIMVAVTFLSANFDFFPYNYKLISHNSDLFFFSELWEEEKEEEKRKTELSENTLIMTKNYDIMGFSLL